MRREKIIFAAHKIVSLAGRAERADQKTIKKLSTRGMVLLMLPRQVHYNFKYQALSSTFIGSAQVCPPSRALRGCGLVLKKPQNRGFGFIFGIIY
jgi:hypothetical protein